MTQMTSCNTVMNKLDKTNESCVTRFVQFCHHIQLYKLFGTICGCGTILTFVCTQLIPQCDTI